MDAPKKKLLIVHMSLYNGGAERSLVNFLTALPEAAYDVDLLLFRTEGLFLPKLPAHVRLLPTPEPLRSLYYNANSVLPRAGGVRGACYKAIRALGTGLAGLSSRGNDNLRRQKRWRMVYRRVLPRVPGEYDVALAYFHGEVSYFVMDKVTAKRKVAFVHNDYAKTGQSPAIDAPYFDKFARVASISALCVDALKKAFPAMPEKFCVVPNLTSSAVVRAMAEEFEPPEFDEGVLRVLSVGRLNPQKACEWSVEAARILRDRGVAFCWYLIGEGGMRAQLEEMIERYHLADRVKLLGVRENPYPYMRACDVFVQNSRYEGKSMVLDEAKILCKPIVATAYPTVADQITDGVEGMVVPMSPEGVADGISRMLDANLRERYAHALAARDYDNTAGIGDYLALLSGDK